MARRVFREIRRQCRRQRVRRIFTQLMKLPENAQLLLQLRDSWKGHHRAAHGKLVRRMHAVQGEAEGMD